MDMLDHRTVIQATGTLTMRGVVEGSEPVPLVRINLDFRIGRSDVVDLGVDGSSVVSSLQVSRSM